MYDRIEMKPSLYTPELAALICQRLAGGESLIGICREDGMPAEATVRFWASKDIGPGFAAQFSEARNIGLEREADEIRELADDCREGRIITKTVVGRACSLCSRDLKWNQKWLHSDDKTPICEGAKAKKVRESKVVTSDAVERSKLQIAVRQWRLERILPRKYGTRVAVGGDPDNPVAMTVTIAQPAKP